MDCILNSQPYGLDGYFDGKRNRRSDQSDLLPEATPLLSKPDLPPHDHPIFLRVCHSPWRFLDQKALLGVRIAIAVYLTTILGLSLWYEIEYAKTGKLYAFEAGNVSLVVQTIYYWISSVWTLQHLSVPHHLRLGVEEVDSGFLSKAKEFFGPPRSSEVDSKSRIAFSIFYTAAVTFPFLVTVMYWLVLFHPDSATVQNPYYINTLDINVPEYMATSTNVTALRYFILVNVYGVSAIIAFAEIMIISSARKQKPFAVHLEGTIIIAILYMIWAVLGRLISGEYVYPYIDPKYAGWRALVCHDLALLSYTMTAFSFQRALHGLRETVAWKAGCDRRNHERVR